MIVNINGVVGFLVNSKFLGSVIKIFSFYVLLCFCVFKGFVFRIFLRGMNFSCWILYDSSGLFGGFLSFGKGG